MPGPEQDSTVSSTTSRGERSSGSSSKGTPSDSNGVSSTTKRNKITSLELEEAFTC